MDIINHGTDEEKSEVSFMMLDIRGQGMIILDSFQLFWEDFLQMYSDLLRTKIKYDEDMRSLTNNIFEQISVSSGKTKVKLFKIRAT